MTQNSGKRTNERRTTQRRTTARRQTERTQQATNETTNRATGTEDAQGGGEVAATTETSPA